MKIIIPMSGVGRRFLEAGYKEPKPLIPVDGKPIIEHVVGMFPGESDFTFICNAQHLAETPMRAILQRLAPRGRIVEIAPHKLGPVHAVLQVAQELADDEPVVVNYCDFSVEWDWPKLKKELEANACDGAVPAYRGFHPHCLGSTNYAYMREKDGWMLEIQEKKPFTSQRMQEYASTGTYYFRRGALVKRYFKELAADPSQTLNGEYYVSMVYNLLVRDGLKVWIPEVPVMLQWGTPEDLEEYQAWSNFFKKEKDFKPHQQWDFQALVPMAGAGSRFVKEGYPVIKPLIPVGGEAMALKAAGSLPLSSHYFFACRSEDLSQHPLEKALKQRFGPGTQIVPVEKLTEGQACTCLLAKPLLDPGKPLVIGACDNGMVWDEAAFAKLVADPQVDCLVWTFRGHPGARRNPEMYGWVQADEAGWVRQVSVKKAISPRPEKDPGVIGCFWFRKASYFSEAAEEMIAKNQRVNGEFYVDACVNTLLGQGRRAKIFDVKHYLCWGTPNDLRTWEYWEGYFERQKQGKSLGRQASRFLVIGLASVATDLIFYKLGVQKFSFPTHVSKGVSYVLGMGIGFLGNKLWTFESQEKNFKEPASFLLLYAGTLAVNIAVNGACLAVLGMQAKWLAFFAATGCTTVLNFLGLRYITFRSAWMA